MEGIGCRSPLFRYRLAAAQIQARPAHASPGQLWIPAAEVTVRSRIVASAALRCRNRRAKTLRWSHLVWSSTRCSAIQGACASATR